MKIAVCASGLIRTGSLENVFRIAEHLGGDPFFATWSSETQEEDNERVIRFDEPIMHYDPSIENADDLPESYRKQYRKNLAIQNGWMHRTKQILGHAYQLNTVPKSYDMIVRVRYDTVFCSSLKINNLIEESYKENKAIGFYVPKGRNKVFLCELQKHEKTHHRCFEHLVDHLIVHPRKMFDIDRTIQLHNTKRLLVAEWGWWQVLSQPYDSNHESYLGFAGVNK